MSVRKTRHTHHMFLNLITINVFDVEKKIWLLIISVSFLFSYVVKVYVIYK
jgi:hypothetical protein